MSKRRLSDDSENDVEWPSSNESHDSNNNNNHELLMEEERNSKKQKLEAISMPLKDVPETTPSLSAEQLQQIEKSRALALERLRISKRRQLLASLASNLHDSWKSIVEPEFEKEYFNSLLQFLVEEKENGKEVYPPEEYVMEAFRTDFNNLKVVIIGQDPYHGPQQAHGLAFSVKEGVGVPPSLVNIFTEIESDLNIKLKKKTNGCLLNWSKQGVLLLNTCLTVHARNAGSHSKQGWETFTSAMIDQLCKTHKDLVFLLWGKYAQSFSSTIERARKNHVILKANHPSPLSASKGFLGCRHFSKTNALLQKLGKTAIDWDPSNSH